MTITLEIKPEVEAELAAQAAARGMDVPSYAAILLEQAAHPTEHPKPKKSFVEFFSGISIGRSGVRFGSGQGYGPRHRVMTGFLLDTNCVSELVRIKPEPRVMEWMLAADEQLLHLSVLTFGEMQGARRSCPLATSAFNWSDGWNPISLPDSQIVSCRLMKQLRKYGVR